MQPNYRPALELAQRNLRALDPELVAERSGAELWRGETGIESRLKLLNREHRVRLPEAVVYDLSTGAEAGVSATLILLHYLTSANGGAIRGEWIPFRGIPGGNVYERAFRQQCIEPLIATFGQDSPGLSRAAAALGGEKDTMGDLSYRFRALPRLLMACVLWLPDEEQGAEVSLLFDAAAPDYLPTEDLAALGRVLTFGLINAHRRNR